MRPLTLEEMAIAIEGRVYGEIAAPSVTSVSTDSRDMQPGGLFFALRGEHHDGHEFVADVLERGALAAVVSDANALPAKYKTGGRLIQVPDTVAALGKLAAWYRRQFAAQVIAVVGSNGKTTTKDMISAVLGSKRPGRAARASFNNHIGVALTLLSVEPADEFLVLEIGTNHPGEIAALGRIARPDIVVITSIGEEHLEFFGSIEAVAAEEFSILTTIRNRAFVLLSEQAAPFAPASIRQQFSLLTYGLEPDSDLRAENISTISPIARIPDRSDVGLVVRQSFQVNGRHPYDLPLPGVHNVVNALAAIALGSRFRLEHDDIASALRAFTPPPMRMEWLRVGELNILNDAYNANPSSMRAAFNVLDQMQTIGRKVFILGDMRELGEQSARCHQMVGREAGRSTANVIITVGAMARVVADGATVVAGTAKRIYSFPTLEAAAEKVPDLLSPGDMILLKASRGVRLERLLEAIKEPADVRATSKGVRRASP